MDRQPNREQATGAWPEEPANWITTRPDSREDSNLQCAFFLPGNQVAPGLNYAVASPPPLQELAERYPRKRHDDL